VTIAVTWTEPDKGPWDGKPTWGQRLLLALPPNEGALISLLTNPGFNGPPRQIGVTLARTVVGGSTSTAINADIRARITYGSGAAATSFDLDWAQGGGFTVQAHTLRVDILSYAPQVQNLAGALTPYNNANLSGGVGKFNVFATVGIDGTSASLPPVFTSQAFALIAANPQQSIPIPQFARRVIPCLGTEVATPAVPGDYLISIVSDFLTMQRYTITDAMLVEGLALPSNASHVVIEKGNPANPDARVSCVFQLGL
jgi:hypothetical protein